MHKHTYTQIKNDRSKYLKQTNKALQEQPNNEDKKGMCSMSSSLGNKFEVSLGDRSPALSNSQLTEPKLCDKRIPAEHFPFDKEVKGRALCLEGCV